MKRPLREMTISSTDEYIIWSGVVIFNIFGQFGNLNVLFAHYRLKNLRTKYGILVTILVSAQSICLAYELVGVVYGISKVNIIRSTCFMVLSPYLFMHCIQMSLMAMFSIDLLISIAYPLRHRSYSKKNYIGTLLIPVLAYAASVILLGGIFTDGSTIHLCQPPFSLPTPVTRYWNCAGLVFNVITIITYAAAVFTIYYNCIQAKKHSQLQLKTSCDMEQRAMRSITVLIILFIFFRLIFLFAVNFVYWVSSSPALIERTEAYMIFPAMMSYSATFYIFFVRSIEYRRIFWHQIASLFACVGIDVHADRFGESSIDEKRKSIISTCVRSNTVKSNLSIADV